MTIHSRQPWLYWVLFGAVLVLIVYPLSLGPALWLTIVWPRDGWWCPVHPLTLNSLYLTYSTPASLLGGEPQNRFGYWLDVYLGWWRDLSLPAVDHSFFE